MLIQSEVGKAVRYALQEVLEEQREFGQLLQDEDDALISPVPWEASHCVTRYRRFWKRRENWLDSCGTRMMLLVSKSSRRSRKRPWSRRWPLVGEWLSSSHMIEPEYRFDYFPYVDLTIHTAQSCLKADWRYCSDNFVKQTLCQAYLMMPTRIQPSLSVPMPRGPGFMVSGSVSRRDAGWSGTRNRPQDRAGVARRRIARGRSKLEG